MTWKAVGYKYPQSQKDPLGFGAISKGTELARNKSGSEGSNDQ